MHFFEFQRAAIDPCHVGKTFTPKLWFVAEYCTGEWYFTYEVIPLQLSPKIFPTHALTYSDSTTHMVLHKHRGISSNSALLKVRHGPRPTTSKSK